MASKTSAVVSNKLMGLKFMQRARAKEDLRDKKEEQVKAQQEEKFVLEKKSKGCVVLEDDFVMHTSGRMSFRNYNPEVDAINAEHQDRIKQIEVEKAGRNDVSEEEMAEVLGKRKHLSGGGHESGGQCPADSKNRSTATPQKSPKTDGQQHSQTKELRGSSQSQPGEYPGSKGRKKGQKHAEGNLKERPGKRKPGMSGSQTSSLKAAAGAV